LFLVQNGDTSWGSEEITLYIDANICKNRLIPILRKMVPGHQVDNYLRAKSKTIKQDG
jgi:hypothetical protein